MKIIAVLALAAIAAPQERASASRFDLVCEGQAREGSSSGAWVPDTYRIRVDLVAGRWCWNQCETTFEIVSVAPEQIVFSDKSVDTYRARSFHSNAVSRVTGEHRMIFVEARPLQSYRETTGHCEAGAFSGFPATRF